jgi:hypothetical protein
MKRRTFIDPFRFAALIALAAAGCTSQPATGDGGPGGTGGADFPDADGQSDAGAPTFTWLYDNIFHVYCSDRNQPCHNPGMNRGVSMSTRDRAFASLDAYVVPGDAFASDLYYLISAGVMPPINPQVPAELQAALMAWLDAGAPNN